LLAQPSLVDPWMDGFKGRVQGLLGALADGFDSMAAEGLPVRCLAPQGAIYLSVHFDLIGRNGITTDEHLRAFLLEEAGVGIVPFTAFGLPDGTGWVRFSVGTATPESVAKAVTNIRAALKRL
ncbi:MAG: aminotransferase class I/II-fold pyridoxal phosphate-dependent enzyme, partial [Myxococcales bacterium]|nr:aminotransferase class I/II-fold pyridoxal phosphate-dependent enzyme [Myxococcales bacterium]